MVNCKKETTDFPVTINGQTWMVTKSVTGKETHKLSAVVRNGGNVPPPSSDD